MGTRRGRVYKQRKLSEDLTLHQFIITNSRRRIFAVSQLARNFRTMTNEERQLALASIVEQFVGATEDLLMAYWTLRLLKENAQLTPLDAYLQVRIRENRSGESRGRRIRRRRSRDDFSSLTALRHLARVTPSSFVKRLGLPAPDRIMLLSERLEAVGVFRGIPDKRAAYESWLSTTIGFLRESVRKRLKDRPTGGSLVMVYNKIKHGSLFVYERSRNELVFPIARGRRRHWYLATGAPVTGQYINEIGKNLAEIQACARDMYFFRLLNEDSEEAIAAFSLSTAWSFSGGAVNL